ncbi:unnamed protein product [Rotaria magnacalcarata]|uniref:Galactokinase n=2 Tax=Rotaria magnacalcarata TaxID=392030 RepID=A0A815INJ1_9BILA|nr:unnamed protein product [Rotaria magnacalcarata]CAF1606997.1 unnamed protein product [Rotaria magnacalcarata]CAF4257591.1 unnamed protein product [Rotaria magnacalcarata]
MTTFAELKANLLDSYRKEFPNDEPTLCSFAPGRVNLIGEHVDYNDGFVFPMAIPLGTVIIGKALDDSANNKCYIRTLSNDVDEPKSVEVDLSKEISRLDSPKWANYVVGVLALFLEHTKPTKKQAFRILIATSVPIGGGLSSSASVEVAMCTFLELLYQSSSANIPALSKVEKALLCCKAEQIYANVPCGIMDQYTACMAKVDHALLIDCRDNTSKYVPMKDKEVCVLVTNSNVKHELVAGTYAKRVKHCQEAAELLGHNKLREVSSMEELEKAHDKMAPVIFKRARHSVTEIKRTEAGAIALSNNDYQEFGRLMYESHASLRDDFEVSCEELDQLVELARSVDGVYGSRMTGGGFGGCTVTLVKKSSVTKCIDAIKKGYKGTASFYEFEPSSGAYSINL